MPKECLYGLGLGGGVGVQDIRRAAATYTYGAGMPAIFRSGSGLSSSTGRSNWARLLGAWGAEGEFLPSLHVLIKRAEIPLPSDNIMSLQGLQAFKNQGWQGVGLKLCRQDGWL